MPGVFRMLAASRQGFPVTGSAFPPLAQETGT
jgi:hypothetical protein